MHHHFKHITLTTDQQNAVEKLTTFLTNDEHIFLLKGYAGTGKTTLISGLVKFLDEQKRQSQVMAPTGRASKILREKTGRGSTIHRAIYELEDVNFKSEKINEKTKEESYKLIFPVANLENERAVLIIDESSMISSKKSTHPLYQFGSEILLKDLLGYAQLKTLQTKIIFVGDPAQLPPVGDNKSWAFSLELFRNKGYEVQEVTLTQIKRQAENSILENATRIRAKINEEHPTELTLAYDDSFIKLTPENIVHQYVQDNPTPQLKSGVVVAFSNAQCYHNNQVIRQAYFSDTNRIQEGDIIQIITNNYNGYPTEIYNGDFAQVLKVTDTVVQRNPSIYVEEGLAKKKVRRSFSFTFRKIIIKLDHFQEPFECWIIESLLNSTQRDLSINELKALYVDFVMRFNEAQQKRLENGQTQYKMYSNEYKEMLKKDAFLNAIRCKYGYAITCHKAQGGEWKKVIVDYSGRVSLKEDPLRWAYTATTRASEICYAVNPPHFNSFSEFQFGDITQISKIPVNAYVFEDIPLSPYHSEGSHLCKSKKFWEVQEQLKDTEFKIVAVFSNDFLERYTISDDENTYVLEGYHKRNGVFTNGIHPTSKIEDEEVAKKLHQIFNNSFSYNFDLKYTPSIPVLSDLYSVIQEVTNELNITITNVVEQPQNYYVNYFFKTDSLCAYIQFFFNNKGRLTSALPKTFNCLDDKKLNDLILKIKNYVG